MTGVQTCALPIYLLADMPSANLTLNPASYVVRQVGLERNNDLVGRTLGDIAQERRTTPAELLVDLSVEEDLKTWFIRADIGHDDVQAVGDMLAHPLVHVGASDGGAHVGSFATYGDTGHLLGQFVRRSNSMRLEEAVKKITLDTATIWGLDDRGVLKDGKAADICVFDPTTVIDAATFEKPIAPAKGIDTVLCNGAIVWRDGKEGGGRKGRALNLQEMQKEERT